MYTNINTDAFITIITSRCSLQQIILTCFTFLYKKYFIFLQIQTKHGGLAFFAGLQSEKEFGVKLVRNPVRKVH